MRESDLKFFKDIIEGNTKVTWKSFWKNNSVYFKSNLSKLKYSQLKFKRLEAAAEILSNNNIDFIWTEKANFHQSISNLSDDFCDEEGYPLLSKKRKLYNGAVGLFLDGKNEEAQEKLLKYVNKIDLIKNDIEKSNEINDLEYEAESFIEQGDFTIGRKILQLIIQKFNNTSDLVQPTVEHAKSKLKSR